MKRRLSYLILIGLLIPVALWAVVIENGKEEPAETIRHQTYEIETHLHSGERWMGAAASSSGTTHIADQVGAGAAGAEAAAFSVDAGNDDWGTWTQIIGSTDTPVDSGNLYFDFHEILITATERNSAIYLVQVVVSAAAPADDPLDGTYTEFMFISTGASPLALAPPVVIQEKRAAAGSNVWMRTRVPNQDTGTMGFYVGLHEYAE